MNYRNRKPNRLKDYDYSSDGFYFLTICTRNREEFLGEIQDREMILNKYGGIANRYWIEIPKHFDNCRLDEFVVMPNHIHGILVVGNNDVGNNDRCSLHRCSLHRNMELIPKIISQYKSSVTREIRKQFENFDFAWQKSFYDHIICNEKSLNNIRQYIKDNPSKLDYDINN